MSILSKQIPSKRATTKKSAVKKVAAKKPSTTSFQDFSKAVDLLIAANKKHRVYMDKQFLEFHRDIVRFAREFATVHVNIGRRTGKTTYIAKHAKKGDLIVVMNQYQREFLQSKYPQLASVKVIIGDERGLENTRGYAFKNIWVDEPNQVFQSLTRNLFYQSLAFNDQQTFIMLGE